MIETTPSPTSTATPTTTSTARPPALARRILSPLVTLVAIVWFLVDVLALTVVHPLVGWVARWPVFGWLGRWIRSLGPYPTLALFVVPLAVLEPAKPAGAWLLATGYPVQGVAVFAVAEVLKIVLVERLFQISKDKLLSIPAFAWVYVRAVRLLERLKATAAWQAVARNARRVREAALRMAAAVRGWG